MREKCKRVLLAVCIASLFMTMPGITVLADKLQEEDATEYPEQITNELEQFCGEAAPVEDDLFENDTCMVDAPETRESTVCDEVTGASDKSVDDIWSFFLNKEHTDFLDEHIVRVLETDAGYSIQISSKDPDFLSYTGTVEFSQFTECTSTKYTNYSNSIGFYFYPDRVTGHLATDFGDLQVNYCEIWKQGDDTYEIVFYDLFDDDSYTHINFLRFDLADDEIVKSFTVGDNVTARLVKENNKNVLYFDSRGGTLWQDWLTKLESDAYNIEIIKFTEDSTKMYFPCDSAGLFAGCHDWVEGDYGGDFWLEKLEQLQLDKVDTSNVINMDHMFGDSDNLDNLDLSSFDTSKVTNMWGMFENCTSLTNLDLSSFVTSNAEDMESMFDNCSNLRILHTPKNNTESVDLPKTLYDSFGNAYTTLPTTKKSIVLAETQQLAQQIESGNDTFISKNYINDADRFLFSGEVQRVVKYLCIDENFANSCYVEQVDSDFFTDFAAAETNMLFRGLDGWRDIVTQATKVEKAEEILVGLLQSYESEVNELTTAKSAQKWADCYLDGLKLYMSAHALENKTLNQITNKDIIKQLQKGEFDEIVEYLKKNKSLDAEAVNALKEYHTSQYFADGITKGLDFLDTGITMAQLTLDTVNRLYELETLAEADEIYCEMLLYLSQNCNYEVIQRAAQNLYDVIHGNYTDQLLYATVALQNEFESQVIDKTLDQVAEAIPYGIIVKKSFDFAVDSANLLFKNGSVQEEKDCMRICTFIGRYLSKWVTDNRLAYLSAVESGNMEKKQEYARIYCYSLYMLAETRAKGEESIQSMLKKSELPFWKTSTGWYKSSERNLSKVNNIITMLKNEKSFKFYCSTVVSCPVNIEVYDADGKLVTTVLDGHESSGIIGEVSYDVYYNPIDNDYDKIIHVPENEGYSIKIIGTNLGKVDCQVSSVNTEGFVEAKSFDNIPIAKDDVIRVDNITVEQQEYSIIRDKTQEKQTFNDVSDIYKEVERITLEKHELELEPESKTVMRVSFLPVDASSKEGYWTSSDASVAEINKEGVITTHKEGSTILTCISYDSDSVFDSCKIIVKNKKSGGISAYRFSDVQDQNHAYFKAIYWAAGEGITKGYSDGTFGINRSCTRGEMMMFLWRYAGKPASKNVSKSPFKDVPKTHTFYKAILWGSQKGITKGYSDGTFGVNRNVSRGECMMFLWRLKGKPAPKAVAKAPFPDVPKSHVFYKAVLWGYQKKITTGFTSGKLKGKFGVNENCSRGQIVTFLYRAK